MMAAGRRAGGPPGVLVRGPEIPMRQPFQLTIAPGDVLQFSADVLALKFAQKLYGADLAVAQQLDLSASVLLARLAREGSYYLVDGRGRIGARQALFVGVPPLFHFRYEEIRAFAGRVLEALAEAAPDTRHLAVTIHGPGYGLDELEAFSAQVAGFLDGQARGRAPPGLERITFVERVPKRAERLKAALDRLRADRAPAPGPARPEAARAWETAGRASEDKPHVFVAMPFTDEFEDVYYYGIEPVVKAFGYLCERADTRSFTGDILDWLQQRIRTAAFVVADLSTANPNVYLEVGYAWGHGRPTILLAQKAEDLKFDVRSHRCLLYKRIRDLEESLRQELTQLQRHG
jgi:hypothetical protein